MRRSETLAVSGNDGRKTNRLARSICTVLFIVALTLLASAADAGNKSGRGKSQNRKKQSQRAAEAARARKIRLINTIERQIEEARKVLAVTQGNSAMSQAQVNEALAKLSGIREEIETAEEEVAQSLATIREMEAEILAEQGPDSEWATAQTVVAQAKGNLHQEMCRVLSIPDSGGSSDEAARLADAANLSAQQRKVLEGDAKYQLAYRAVKDALARLNRLREQLFRADEDWVAAQEDLADARQWARNATEHAQAAGTQSLGDRQNLHQSQQLAAAARAVIAQGETRLRRLGPKPKPKSNSGKSSGSKAKR